MLLCAHSSGRPRGLPVPSAGPLASEESPGLMQTAGGFSLGLRARSVDGPSSGSPPETQLLDLDFPGAPGIPVSASSPLL